jgi:hypothetical protein
VRRITGTGPDGSLQVISIGEAPVVHRFEGTRASEAVVRDLWGSDAPDTLEAAPAGELTLLLETGEITLAAGDAFVLPGVVHGWRTDRTGCTLLVTLVGTTSTRKG